MDVYVIVLLRLTIIHVSCYIKRGRNGYEQREVGVGTEAAG